MVQYCGTLCVYVDACTLLLNRRCLYITFKSVLGTVDVERITAVATIGVGRWLGAKLNQKSRGWGCFLHLWQHRASSNHNFFCFAYDYVGNTEITERLVMVVQLGNPQYQAAQIHCKSTQMVVSSYL